MSKDLLYFVVKLAASTVAAAYGIFATVTDFHEQRDGRQTLSHKGKWGIVILVFSSLLGISSDWWKERKEQADSLIVAQQLQGVSTKADKTTNQLDHVSTDMANKFGGVTEQLAQTSNTIKSNLDSTKTVLRETRRAVDPLENGWSMMHFDIYIDPHQELLQPYLQRIEREYILGKESIQARFLSTEQGFPDAAIREESAFAELADFQNIQITLTKRGSRSPGNPLTATFKAPSDSGKSVPEKTIEFEKHLAIEGETGYFVSLRSSTPTITEMPEAQFRSYADIEGATVAGEIAMMDRDSLKYSDNRDVQFVILSAYLLSPAHRMCSLQDTKLIACDMSGFKKPFKSYCFRATVTCD